MSKQDLVDILRQGAEIWNQWRNKNRDVKLDFFEADLHGLNLGGCDLFGAIFTNSDLHDTLLIGADLRSVRISDTNLRTANLRHADLSEAVLNLCDLKGALLRGAKLTKSKLISVNLVDTDLTRADFVETELNGVIVANTTFSKTNLSQASGLDSSVHLAPSSIDNGTIEITTSDIPESFLRGCGWNDWEIESAKLYQPNLSNQEINNIIYKIFDLRAHQSIQVSPLFISYSHANTNFVEKLENRLTSIGIRYWRDVHNATSGRLEKQIDHAMRQNPTVILILSEDSINSDWVEHEARLARKLEKELGRDVLCPIALDASWLNAKWPARLMEQIKEYHVLDFSNWAKDEMFEKVFNKMILGLDRFYKE